MFTPARMVRIDCVIAQEKRKDVSQALQTRGITEVEFLSNEFLDEKKVGRSRPDDEVNAISEKIISANKLIDYFAEYDNEKLSFIEDILGVEKIEPTETKRLPLEKLLYESTAFLSGLEERVSNLSQKIAKNERRVEELHEEKETLECFSGLNFKVEWVGESEYVCTRAGILNQKDVNELRTELAKELGDSYGMESSQTKDGGVSFLVYTAKEGKESLEKALRRVNCEMKTFRGSGRVRELLSGIEDELKTLYSEEKNLMESREELFNLNYRRLLETHELLLIEKKKCEIFVRCGQTEKTFLMMLWSLRKDKEDVLDLIQKKTGGLCFIDVDENPDDAPTLLENPPVIKSFEVLTKLFSPPRYREVDPTMIIAPTFALFFGLMLTDAVYGLFIALVAYFLIKKYGRYSRGLYDLCTIIIACGASAILFGFLTGSFLGDLIGKYILGGVGSQTVALWMDPMYGRNSIILLAVVCTAGLLHSFLGYFIGMCDLLEKGKYKEALINYGSWFILALGILIIVLVKYGRLTHEVIYAGYVLSLLGLILSFLRSSLMALMEITGLVGNALSYARLLALALTTSGIAMTFNFLAGIALKVPYVGIILAAIVFIFGHVMNILINTLGGFVHSLRLHYLEFFGTFYQGGGREFTPFREERKYTKTR